MGYYLLTIPEPHRDQGLLDSLSQLVYFGFCEEIQLLSSFNGWRPLGKRSPTCWAIAYGTVVARSKKCELFNASISSGSWKILNSGNLTRKMWHRTRHSVAAASFCIRELICVVQMVPALPKQQVCDQRSHSFDLTTDLGGRIIEYFTAFGTWRVQLSCCALPGWSIHVYFIGSISFPMLQGITTEVLIGIAAVSKAL